MFKDIEYLHFTLLISAWKFTTMKIPEEDDLSKLHVANYMKRIYLFMKSTWRGNPKCQRINFDTSQECVDGIYWSDVIGMMYILASYHEWNIDSRFVYVTPLTRICHRFWLNSRHFCLFPTERIVIKPITTIILLTRQTIAETSPESQDTFVC